MLFNRSRAYGRGFANYAFCGYDGILFSDARRAGYAAKVYVNGTYAGAIHPLDARVLTNYEMISVGWKLIGELAPVVANMPGVEVSADETARRLDLTVK